MLRPLFFVILFLSHALSNDFYKGDSQVKKGVYAFYNYDFDQAVDILSDAREKYPDHPGVHLIWAASRWVRSQANSSIEETYNTLESDLKEIEPIYKDLVYRFPFDPNYQLYQGSALGLSARVTLGKKQWLKTLYRSYQGFSIIDDVAEKSPQIMDAKLPIGIIEYYSAISNPFLKWTISLYGLNGSRESGLRKMSEAAEEADWAWIEANYVYETAFYLMKELDVPMLIVHDEFLVPESRASGLEDYMYTVGLDEFYYKTNFTDTIFTQEPVDFDKFLKDLKV